jgi:hypothetical protein
MRIKKIAEYYLVGPESATATATSCLVAAAASPLASFVTSAASVTSRVVAPGRNGLVLLDPALSPDGVLGRGRGSEGGFLPGVGDVEHVYYQGLGHDLVALLVHVYRILYETVD